MEVLSFFAEHVEAVVSIVIGIVATIVVGYLGYKFTVTPKQLAYRIDLLTALRNSGIGNGKLSVHLGARELELPVVVTIRVVNVSRSDIKGDDFVRPLRINFAGAKIVQAVCRDRSDRDITPELVLDGKSAVTWKPELLNPGEWAEFEFLLDGYPSTVVTVRLPGRGSGIRYSDDLRPRRSFAVVVGALILGLVGTWIGWLWMRHVLGDYEEYVRSQVAQVKAHEFLYTTSFSVVCGLIFAAGGAFAANWVAKLYAANRRSGFEERGTANVGIPYDGPPMLPPPRGQPPNLSALIPQTPFALTVPASPQSPADSAGAPTPDEARHTPSP